MHNKERIGKCREMPWAKQVTSERRTSRHSLWTNGYSVDPDLSHSSAKPKKLVVSSHGSLHSLAPLSHFKASLTKLRASRVRAVEQQSCALRGGAEVAMLCCLHAKEWLQEARDSGMTRRTFQKLLTGAAGSYHGQHRVTARNSTGARGRWHSLPLRVMRHKSSCCQ